MNTYRPWREMDANDRRLADVIGSELGAGRECCDFCTAPDPPWTYPAEDFIIAMPDGPDVGSEGGWGACEHCHDLIEADDRRGLLMRSALRFAVRYQINFSAVVEPIERNQQGFFDHRTGEAVREV